MYTTGRKSSRSSGSSSNGWTFRRQPKREQPADFVLPEIEPYYPNRLRNRIIFGVVLLVLVVAAVSVGVVLFKSDSDKAVSVQNRTVAGNETPSVRSIVDQFLAGLPDYSLKLAENDMDSPQAKALSWLQDDPQYNDYSHVYRLNQRYALAVFYYSTNGASMSSPSGEGGSDPVIGSTPPPDRWLLGQQMPTIGWNNTDKWLTDDNECTWYMNDYGYERCGADSRLRLLDLFENNVGGSIPTEVELLTDLEQILLGTPGASDIRGTIPTEM
jgi:hypothetical protein